MDKLIKVILIRYLMIVLVGLVALLKLNGCAGASIPISTSQPNLSKLDQLGELTQPKKLSRVAREAIAEMKSKSARGIFQISVLGSKQFDGLALLSAKAQILDSPRGTDWIDTFKTRLVPLGEKHGKAFLFFTENEYLSIYPIRHLITAQFPSGGGCYLEIAKAGALFRFDEKAAPSIREVSTFAIYFDEPHQVAGDLRGSVWDLTWKYVKTDPVTGDTDSYEGGQQLERGEADQLWIQMIGRSVAFRSAATLEAATEIEKPALTIDNLVSLTIKRIDPKSAPA